MGNWNISIHGVGVHHNVDLPQDADKMATRFVADLLKAGHTVKAATITYGGEQDILNDNFISHSREKV